MNALERFRDSSFARKRSRPNDRDDYDVCYNERSENDAHDDATAGPCRLRTADRPFEEFARDATVSARYDTSIVYVIDESLTRGTFATFLQWFRSYAATTDLPGCTVIAGYGHAPRERDDGIPYVRVDPRDERPIFALKRDTNCPSVTILITLASSRMERTLNCDGCIVLNARDDMQRNCRRVHEALSHLARTHLSFIYEQRNGAAIGASVEHVDSGTTNCAPMDTSDDGDERADDATRESDGEFDDGSVRGGGGGGDDDDDPFTESARVDVVRYESDCGEESFRAERSRDDESNVRARNYEILRDLDSNAENLREIYRRDNVRVDALTRDER